MVEMSKIPRTADTYFDSIRPYMDHEVHEVVTHLLESEEIRRIALEVFQDISEAELNQKLDTISTVADFKEKLLAPVVCELQKRSVFSLPSSGKSQLDTSGQEKYLYISNHRDIILDSAFLNVVLLESGLPLPRIGIGDNLLITDWIKDLVRLADAFIVKRKLSLREMIEESKRLSMYIRSSIIHKEASVWLAQSEGRRKNSDDRTQLSVLKMLMLSSEERDPVLALEPLNIVPVSITYEYDPCDYLKAQEMLQKELNPEWTKSPMDDMISMHTGLTGYKGRVHIAITKPLHNLKHVVRHASNYKEALMELGHEIDRQIFLNYRFYPPNYAAYDLLYGGAEFSEMYSTKERASFELYLDEQIAKVKVDGKKDRDFLLNKLLEMYSMPLKNFLITKKRLR